MTTKDTQGTNPISILSNLIRYAAQIGKGHVTVEILEGYDGWVGSILTSSDSGTVYNCFVRTTSIWQKWLKSFVTVND